MDDPDDDLPALVQAFYAGDDRALASIYASWAPMVYSLALRSLGSISDAEEVTQQVFTGAWTSRHSFDSTQVRLPIWLIGITKDRIVEVRAARNQQARTAGAAPGRTQTEPADLVDTLLLADELSRLDAASRQVLRLALNDNLTHVQIAERLGLPPGSVKSQISRGLRKLRQGFGVQADAY